MPTRLALPFMSQVWGHYRILETIGAGGMGEVYRARDDRLDRDVALKVLKSSLADDQDRLRRFEQEARAAAALSHPNIVAIYDIGRTWGLWRMSHHPSGTLCARRWRHGPWRLWWMSDHASGTLRAG